VSAVPLAAALALVAGLALLVLGGELLVRGAAALARRLGVPPLAIGLTVVAFGTSTPELAVNVTAALRGSGAVAFGNVIGSNLANVGLILGLSALVRSLAIRSSVLTREIPMMLLASTAALILGSDGVRLQPESSFDRADGLIFLLLFTVFLYYTVADTLRKRSADPLVAQAREQAVETASPSLAASAVLVVAGLAALVIGGRLAVTGAVDVANALGVPRHLIGLSVVAVGTSLPELTTSVLAARKGECDLAIGNVVGSNIFNLLFVMGLTAVIRPVPVPPGGTLDMAVMLGFGAALLLPALGGRGLGRPEGAVLLAGYLAYIGWRAV
jgi:cation:H+ antiporter